MKIAVIDIGSNSVRMLFGENGNYDKLVKITKLAKSLVNGCELSIDAMKRTADAVLFFVNEAKKNKITNILIFATAAVRNAKNKDEFLKIIKDSINIDVDVVSGELEGKLGHLGVYSGLDGGIIDIGGASSEITVFKNNECVYSHSMPYGAVNLTNLFKQDTNKIREFLFEQITEFGVVPKTTFSIIGGTASNCASVLLKLKDFDSKIVDGTVIEKEKVNNLLDDYIKLSYNEKEKIIGLQKERIENFHAGLLILSSLFSYLKIDKMILSEKDNLEGYLIYKLGKL